MISFQLYSRRQWIFLIKQLSPFVLAFIACTLGLVALLYYNGSHLLQKQLEERILSEIEFLDYEFREDGPIELLEEIEERLEKNSQSWRYLYAVQAPNGDWVFDTLNDSPPAGWSVLWHLDYAEQTLAYTQLLPGDYRLTVGLARNDLKTYKNTFVTFAGWLMVISIFISIILGALLYQRFIYTVRQVARPVQLYSEGHFNARISPLTADPELERLAININHMFEQIQRLVSQLKKLSANIAHDLRTPLTRVKNHLTLIPGGTVTEQKLHIESAEKELDEVLRLFREILHLTEIQAGGLQNHFISVDIPEIIEACVELYEPLFEEKNIKIIQDVPQHAFLRGSPQLLKQVLVNLIENTINHTAGECSLTFKLEQKENTLFLNISDTGISSVSTKKHFGIGLGFVTAIVELHGGTAEYEDLHGKGYMCRIRFPAELK
ncbi:Sensor histidine kinase MtrB [Thalassocella blandensis]|nr:Sensor histidine kinase MtrB [Thalassocella blandensis]